MSGLLLSLSLLYAATFLQSSASADDCDFWTKTVCLTCNTTVTVEAGQEVTLKCSIHPAYENFNGIAYVWREGKHEITCNSSSMEYNCEWDTLTYVSLIISNVVKDTTYTVEIKGNHGIVISSPIKVQVIKRNETIGLELATMPQPATIGKAFILLIFLPLIASGILCFLFGTNRGRKIRNAISKRLKKTQGDHSDVNTAPRTEDLLTA